MTVESSYHSSNPEIQSLTEQSKKYADEIMSIVDEVQKVIVGQEDVIKKLVIALMADGHVPVSYTHLTLPTILRV